MTKESIFVDTGAWFAYINASDPDHSRVRQFLDQSPGRVSAIVEMIHITPSDEKAAWNLFEKRADKSYSFTDCTSFVVMRRQKIATAVALDSHFFQEGFIVAPE